MIILTQGRRKICAFRYYAASHSSVAFPAGN
jgi:hypothetical protein